VRPVVPIPEPRPQRIKAGDTNIRVERQRIWIAVRRYSGYPSETLTLPFTSGKAPHAMPRRPLSKLMTRITNATTSSKWMRPPPIWRLKPKSHKIPRTTKIVQSIFVLLCELSALPKFRSGRRSASECSGCCSCESASFEFAMLSRIAHLRLVAWFRRWDRTTVAARAVYAMPFRGATGCLSGFERLAALQATGSVARGDESTKRAHPLGREIPVAWFHADRLPQRRSQESAQTADAAKKGLREGSHG
jgi:hypothetical protein